MFANHLSTAINTASLSGCDEVARTLWKAYSAGAIDDPAAEALGTALEARRRVLRGQGHERAADPPKPLGGPPGRFPPRRKQVSPDRRRSRERRRTLAASGPMPPALAAKFTQGELAVLFIVVAEVRAHGLCSLTLGALSARAGCCRTTAQNALRAAAKARLLTVTERRRRGCKSLPNLIRIVSPEWLSWIAFKSSNPTGISLRNKGPGQSYGAPRRIDQIGRRITEAVAEAPKSRWRRRVSGPD